MRRDQGTGSRKYSLPSVGTVDIAGTQRAAFQMTELVEHEQRMRVQMNPAALLIGKSQPIRGQAAENDRATLDQPGTITRRSPK
jgi:hypothetical protein